ncbi:isoprenylcysteine carboxylmethyltransferase family protein [Pseudomonas sp. OIL-1]|uniref:methyltransferase family protein n=1 Tax=Pseudomonas sp. OIL-1 TaxID=2706126 RepID=UPI0013A7517D|nr:isoprenylcysteine carboxylmethyltransferase family protein [Pseudomonas sp. OIL-1]QIB50236.1 isoprenylcysteine carboxylmethyltransferase family protein [Pseudomonas sp. OIL-1]
MNKLELKVPPLVLVTLCMLLMWAISHLFAGLSSSIPGASALAGLLAAAGVFIAVAGVVNFRQARTTVDPTAPERATSIVSSGIYRSSRNPMYLGFALCLAAWAVWLENPPAFLVLPGFVLYMNRFQIRPEERMLSEKFGSEYSRYCQSVRRWF